MLTIYIVAAFWFLSALVSTIIANRLKISNALMEIIIGALVGFIAFKIGLTNKLALEADWMKFIAGLAAIMLTFLSGTELNPDSLKSKFKEITIVGLVGFFAPFIGACFVNDLGTVIGLGLIFAPFTSRTLIFLAVTLILIFILPSLTNYLIKHFAYKTAAIRTKWILFVLLSMGVLAMWSGSEPVLPAYIIGMILSRTIEKDNFFVRRLRTMTIGFLTPIYFLRAGALVSLPDHLLEKPVLDDQLPDIIKAKK